jgi:hypothetical protein
MLHFVQNDNNHNWIKCHPEAKPRFSLIRFYDFGDSLLSCRPHCLAEGCML